MLSKIWTLLIISSCFFAFFNGTTDLVVASIITNSKLAIEILIGLLGIMSFWLGLMKIAEAAGLIEKISKFIQPFLKKIFPEIPENHPAIGAITMNLSANLIGLDNAATPFGLKAMEELQKLNNNSKTASRSMCMFLAINTSSVQIIPISTMALLVASGSDNPVKIVIPTLLATTISTIVAIFFAKINEIKDRNKEEIGEKNVC